MTNSQNLLTEYVANGSQGAFRELVASYVDLVYSVARRLVDGDAHRAEDVAQMVFVDLARIAPTLSPDVMLGGWLHRHTCFVASNIMRGERRRQFRERQAVEMNMLHHSSGTNFQLIAPILDEAINHLGEADRTAILLRFFQRCDFRSVGEALGSNEDAARMRVNRALRKLQALLARRGIRNSAGALALVLSANSVHAAPAGLALTISNAAVLAGTATSGSAAVAATKTTALTALPKIVAGTVVVIALGTGIYTAPGLPGFTFAKLTAIDESFYSSGERSDTEGAESVAQLQSAPRDVLSLEALSNRGQRQDMATHSPKDPLWRLARMQEALNLTAEQELEIREILAACGDVNLSQSTEIMNGSRTSEAAGSSCVDAGSQDDRINALLTREQQDAYEEFKMKEALDCPSGPVTTSTA